MDKIKATEGDLVVRDAHFGIVAARFNDFHCCVTARRSGALPASARRCGCRHRDHSRARCIRNAAWQSTSWRPVAAATASSLWEPSFAVARRISTMLPVNASREFRQPRMSHSVPIGLGVLTVRYDRAGHRARRDQGGQQGRRGDAGRH